jgi:hypothetical protein
MDVLMNKLPMDIVLQIIPYTYQLQNKNLLDDIIDFTKSKTILFELYHKYWIIGMQYHDNTNEDKYWLINDIHAYANNYRATMYGYLDKFYNIFKRNKFLKTNEDIDIYLDNLEKKDVSSQINVFLGLLTIKERHDIIVEAPILNE